MNDKQIEAIAELLWDYLKKDPEHKDRRRTAFGTKTKEGLALSIQRVIRDNDRLCTDVRCELPANHEGGCQAAEDE